ncbi:MAG: hypothetical protein JSW14_06960 [Candidatus Bathyarchaeum sp.]|nr:MAG: hypothetical protein JSW14_06960 [Candidatus Bathyarchaeum sp.]
MSEDMPTGLLVAEKLFGLILIIIGATVTYFTSTNPPAGDTGILSNLFIIAGITVLGIGVLLVLAKTK